tara:strand:+ start:422 stop:709 length:288 start_codon:yes stop_codon:yes gene_type:complete
MSQDLFDFGFTAVDEHELEAVQKEQAKAATIGTEAAKAAESARTNQKQLDDLYNAIVPLLNNLKKNPQKEYILWPNRLKKVEEFETHLQKIYKGE